MRHLSRAELERTAWSLVADYKRLPALEGKVVNRVDPELFARKLLGLSVEYHVLSPDGSVLGETACEPIGVPIFDAPDHPEHFFLDGRTVLIDQSLIERKANKGRYHFTLIHEACHQILGMLFHTDIGRGSPRNRIHYCVEGNQDGDDYWDEWRANTLASAILMPADMVRANMKEFGLGDEIGRLNKVFSPREFTRFCKMTDFMGVSHQALSIRLMQLGMLKERNNYLDNSYRLVDVFPGEEWE